MMMSNRRIGLWLSLMMTGLFSLTALAGGGHDHGHDAAPVTADPNKPQRLPDGSLFLPKPTQRFINLRTQTTKTERLPLTIKLNGRVITGSNAIGKVLALQTGRLDIIGDTNTLPAQGDQVKKGQKLATITWVGDIQEGTNQAAEVADLREQLKLAKREHQRVKKLATLISQREIDVAAATVLRLKARISALSKGGKKQEVLRVPLSGIVTGSYATDGQAIQAGDLLLDIIDPKQLQVEALTFDPALTSNIHTARLQLDQRLISLRYKGTSPRLRQQALPLRFSVTTNDLSGLVAGLSVQVLVQTKEKQQGIAILADALARNASNQSIVWIKTAPEHYTPRVIQYQPLDGERVLVTKGLDEDERVVIQATTLINQIR